MGNSSSKGKSRDGAGVDAEALLAALAGAPVFWLGFAPVAFLGGTGACVEEINPF